MGGLYALGEALSMGLTGLAYLFVCLKAWAGAFGVGEITQYVGAMTQLFAGVTGLLRVFGEVRSNADFLETCFTFLDLPNPMYQGSLTTEKRSGPPVPGGVPGRVLPLPGERALGAAPCEYTISCG